MMENSNIHLWFIAIIALVLLILPVLLADELSLFENWLFTFSCWLIIIIFGLLKLSPIKSRTDKTKE